jgi:uncharacterized protein DUF2510
LQKLVAGTSAVPGYAVTPAGHNALLLVRQYIPAWAVLVVLLTLGLLFLLVRSRETLTATVSQVPEGTKVSYSGLASLQLIARLEALRVGLTSGIPGAPNTGWHPDPLGRFQYRYYDGLVWTEYVSKAGAQSTDPLLSPG